MKNENEFNGVLGKHIKRYWGQYFHTKNSDKYRVGVPDFYIWGNEKHASIECKFIKSVPIGDKEQWLKAHKFSPAQTTFLHCVGGSGGKAFGLIGVGDKKKMFLVHHNDIGKTGNISTASTPGKWFDISKEGTIELLEYIFKENTIWSMCSTKSSTPRTKT